MRRTLMALGVGLIVASTPVTALAQYPPDRPICVVDRSRAAPGDELTITGDRWGPSSSVDIDFEQDDPAVARDLGAARANSAGTFVETVTIPADAHGGPARLVLTGRDGSGAAATCTATITITGDVDAAACAQVSDDVVQRGQQIRVFSADGCWEAGTDVELTFLSTPVPLGSAPVRADGSFSRTVRIPVTATTGPHHIRVRGTDASGAAAVVSIPIEVIAGRGAGGLAGTGLGLLALLALAVGLFCAGGSILLSANRIPAHPGHAGLRQARERRTRQAWMTFGAGAAALAAWLWAAALSPGDPSGLSWAHPFSVGTVLLGVVAGWTLWLAMRVRSGA